VPRAQRTWSTENLAQADIPADEDDSTTKQAKQKDPNEKILYDACTIRTWFMMMDGDGDGVISKDEFVSFLRERPALQKMLLSTGPNRQADSDGEGIPFPPQTSQRMAQAVLQRRLIKLFNEIDVNKNKRMEFEEFLTFFRRAGCLLEYTLTDNPRDRAAELLASVPSMGGNVRSSAQAVRRGSECSWAINQLSRLRVPDHASPRRHSDSAVLESPAAFWEEAVVLGPRRPPWGRRICGISRPSMEESTPVSRSDVSLDDLNVSPNTSQSRKSSLWLRRRSDGAAAA
jgi:hypothetical protein